MISIFFLQIYLYLTKPTIYITYNALILWQFGQWLWFTMVVSANVASIPPQKWGGFPLKTTQVFIPSAYFYDVLSYLLALTVAKHLHII